MQQIRWIVFFLFSGICAAEDLKNRRIRIDWFLLFGIVGLVLFYKSEGTLVTYILAAVPGILTLLLSRFFHMHIGEGDAFLLLDAAFYMPLPLLLQIIVFSLILCSAYALAVCAYCFVQGKHAGKQGIPFAPFFLLAAVFYRFLI